MAFSTVPMLCKYHRYQVLKHFITPKEPPHPRPSPPGGFLPLQIYFFWMVPGILQHVAYGVSLLSLSVFPRFTHITACAHTSPQGLFWGGYVTLPQHPDTVQEIPTKDLPDEPATQVLTVQKRPTRGWGLPYKPERQSGVSAQGSVPTPGRPFQGLAVWMVHWA